jgi:broad specificity phosphatase PhoE
MTTRLTLVCHAATAATRRAAFPGEDEPILDEAAKPVARVDIALTGPEPRCRRTAELLGLNATVDPRLRDCDYRDWIGRTLAELEPEAVAAWLSDPAAVPHGGESGLALLARVAGWLDQLDAPGRIVAVTHPSVIRAALVHAIRATPATFWRIDIAPLSHTVLSGRNRTWTLRSLG